MPLSILGLARFRFCSGRRRQRSCSLTRKVFTILFLLVCASLMCHADSPTPPGKIPGGESRPAPDSSRLVSDRTLMFAMAGGSILVAGVVLWAVLGSGEDEKAAKPDLGNPPEEPIVQVLK